MTDQEKQKLKEKLARWVGWHEEKYEIARGAFAPILLAPNEGLDEGHVGYIPEHTPDFPNSYNDCLKWLMPKLLEECSIESYSFRQRDNRYYSETNIWRKGSTRHGFEVLYDERIAKHYEQGTDLNGITALALCLAIEKVVDLESET